MKQIISFLYGGYLGAALSAFGDIKFYQWQFWAIIIPLVILVEIKAQLQKD